MKYEILHNLRIPKIGFGTWRIGGENDPDPAQDARSLAALRSALELGYTHFDTAESYAAGHAEELIGRAVRAAGISREKLFITSKVSPEHLGYEDVLRCCGNSLQSTGHGISGPVPYPLADPGNEPEGGFPRPQQACEGRQGQAPGSE